MPGFLAIAITTAFSPVCMPAGTPHPQPLQRSVVFDVARASIGHERATLRELYEEGVDFDAFLNAAEARRPLWLENWGRANVDGATLERARAVPGTWRILAVAVDACSDSVNTIPFIAKLAELVQGIELRIVGTRAGKEIMESHRTPDGRAATPTLLLLDEEWQEAGCWVERPLILQTWYAEKQKELSQRDLTAQKMAWYSEDAGVETVAEIIAMIEGAAAGQPLCAAPIPETNR